MVKVMKDCFVVTKICLNISVLETRPMCHEIVFCDEQLPTMTWRYPEPRSLSSINITPVPFTTFSSYPSPVVQEDCLVRM